MKGVVRDQSEREIKKSERHSQISHKRIGVSNLYRSLSSAFFELHDPI